MACIADIQGVIDHFYGIISGKAGEARDWNSFRSLFYSEAHLTTIRLSNEKECTAITNDVESYILRLQKFLEAKDFYEYGFNYQVRIFGNIAHVYSEYEAKVSELDKEPIKRGVNLVQLIQDGLRWKILNMLWQDKRC